VGLPRNQIIFSNNTSWACSEVVYSIEAGNFSISRFRKVTEKNDGASLSKREYRKDKDPSLFGEADRIYRNKIVRH
jgi:hypothetical protein